MSRKIPIVGLGVAILFSQACGSDSETTTAKGPGAALKFTCVAAPVELQQPTTN